jgi:hypothetical protein
MDLISFEYSHTNILYLERLDSIYTGQILPRRVIKHS